METGHPSTRAVNSGRQLGWWKPGFSDSTKVCAVLIADAPGEPKDIAIDKFDRSSVTLKWKPPNDDGGNPIKGLHKMLYFSVLSFLTSRSEPPVTPFFSVLCFAF